MNVIAIYHHPQECGSPYICFVSQKTGQVVHTVDLPDPWHYTSSGSERITQLQRVSSYTEHICQSQAPTLDTVRPTAYYRYNPHHYEFRVADISNVKEDASLGLRTWTADIKVDVCIPKTVWRYSSKEDFYRRELESKGFDMTGWCNYRRRRTDYYQFLESITRKYRKDYRVISFIRIG